MKQVCITVIIPSEINLAIERKAKIEGKLKRTIVCEALSAYIKK